MAAAADSGMRRFIAWMSVAIVVIAADQATKWAIIEWVPLYGKVPINSFLNLTHQQNAGAAFSFLASAVRLAALVFRRAGEHGQRRHRRLVVAYSAGRSAAAVRRLTLVLGGAVGNLIDRAVLGYVTDFIQVWFGSWPFPSFNVADSAISVGRRVADHRCAVLPERTGQRKDS